MTEADDCPRVVFDCNTFVQALAFGAGSSAESLRIVESGRAKLCVSSETLAELKRVVRSDSLRARFQSLSEIRIDGFLQRVAYKSKFIARVSHKFHFSRDPEDEPYLDLCLACKAAYLVTSDKDMLSISTGRSLFCKDFRQRTRPLKIVTPTEFVREMTK